MADGLVKADTGPLIGRRVFVDTAEAHLIAGFIADALRVAESV